MYYFPGIGSSARSVALEITSPKAFADGVPLDIPYDIATVEGDSFGTLAAGDYTITVAGIYLMTTFVQLSDPPPTSSLTIDYDGTDVVANNIYSAPTTGLSTSGPIHIIAADVGNLVRTTFISIGEIGTVQRFMTLIQLISAD